MERALYIENYRNIGLENSERLVLNYSLEKGKMGNLIFVVGANNAGKSNLLDALNAFATKRFEPKDKTMLNFDSKHEVQKLTLICKEDDNVNYYRSIDSLGRSCSGYNLTMDRIKFEEEEITEAINKLLQLLSNIGYSDSKKFYDETIRLQQTIKSATNEQAIEKFKELIAKIDEAKKSYYNYKNVLDRFFSTADKSNKVIDYIYANITEDKASALEKIYKIKFGTSFTPKINKYEERVFKTKDLETTPSAVRTNKFFMALFKLIDIDINDFETIYKRFIETNSRGILTTFENKINSKLDNIKEKFNELYFAKDGTYSFKITLESQKIFFELHRNSEGMVLDYQSTGFKWFFNLYFNLIGSSDLNPGDILIMDEPATNLHVKGQIELRKFLKNFAIKNDIVIIIATHSPFLIDLDYLDEVRVIENNDNKVKIINDFSAIDSNDHDTLKAIRESLTVYNYMLVDNDKKVVFVEGITDYNYMVTFKKIFKIEDIIFLPVNGIGDIKDPELKDKQKSISKILLKIRRNGPVLMVDSDQTGKSMSKINKESELCVFKLKDVDDNFKDIESLFDEKDLIKYKIKIGDKVNKHCSNTSLIKTYCTAEDFSEITLDNFKKLFNYLENEI